METKVTDVTRFILKERRQYFIDKVKAPIRKALVILADRYPEPTMDNVTHPNDKVWLRIWGRFFQMEDNPGREPLFKAIRKVSICEPAHDPYYRDRQQVILEEWLTEVLEGHWKPRSLDHPESNWKVDPNVRGLGYQLLKTCYYYPELREKIKKLTMGVSEANA